MRRPTLAPALARTRLRLRAGVLALVTQAPLAALAVIVGASAAASGCAHGEALEGGVLHKGGLAVRLGPVPPGWTRIHVGGADVAYRDEGLEGSTLVDVRCSIRDGDAPLAALTGHLIAGTTQREFQLQETIAFDGREALHTLMAAKLDGVPMQYELYVMKKDGCVYDLVYVAPPGLFERGSPGFERFALGLHASSAAPGQGVAAGRSLSTEP